MKYIPSTSYVTIDPDFRTKLFNKAVKKAGSRAKLAKILNTNKWTFDCWKYGKKRPPLGIVVECANFVEIPSSKLLVHITDIRSLFNSGRISVNNWKLLLNEEFAEWLGMLQGDGSLTSDEVKISNTYIDIPIYFADLLTKTFGIEKSRIKIVISFFTDDSITEANKIKNIFRKRKFTNIELYKAYQHKGNKIVITTRVYSKILQRFLIGLMKDLVTILKMSPNSVKAAYVRGFAAAEGCISEGKSGVRIITITQNDAKELEFVKSLLNNIGITNIGGPRSTGTAFRIGITTQIELEKFQKLVGFGKHKLKNEALTKIIKHYKFRVYRTPTYLRYEEINRIIKNQKYITVKSLAKILSLDCEHVRFLLNNMLRLGLVNVDKTHFPHIYSLGGKIDQS